MLEVFLSNALSFVTYLLLPALSALLGAWAGATLALDRFKKERAYDRQLEWLEATLVAVDNYNFRMQEVLDDLAAHNFNAVAGDLKGILNAAESLMLLLPKAAMYADSKAVAIAVRVEERLSAKIEGLTEQGFQRSWGGSNDPAQFAHELRVALENSHSPNLAEIQLFRAALCRDLRKHLGLEQLPG